MQHSCQDCQHQFWSPGQSEGVQAAAQCPNCHSYRTQPGGIPDEANDMLHGLDAMPTSTEDDMSGNPLKEGILADGGWQNRQKRDESFASVRKRSDFPSLFETTELTLPEDLYRHALDTEASHQATIQLPKGITNSVHASLGNLGAWVENPHENGQLRPYHNKYWKVIRPAFMKPGSLRIGVADPNMAEIINHVAQTDDLTPLYEYRGKVAKIRTAGPLLGLVPEGLAGLLGGGAAAETAGAVGEQLALPGMESAGLSAAAPGGIVNKIMKGVPMGAGMEVGKGLAAPVVNLGDDLIGGMAGSLGGGPGAAGGGVNPPSFYSRTATDEDDAHPGQHDEIPKNEDGDSKQQDDGNNHEWQRDVSVNGTGGTDQGPHFSLGGPGMERFMMLLPLIKQYLDSGEDASGDPLIQGLHQTLESEVPGYRDHGDENEGMRLMMVLGPQHKGEPEPQHGEKNETDATDANSGGKKEAHSHLAAIDGDFLPMFSPISPGIPGLTAPIKRSAMYPHAPSEIPSGVLHGPIHENEEVLDSSSWPQNDYENCPHCNSYVKTALGMCPQCGQEVYPHGQGQAQAMEFAAKLADTQGPHTPEQIEAVQRYLMEHGEELGLSGQSLVDAVLSVPTNPLEFADVLAKITQQDPPPVPEDAGMSAAPPAPPQEGAPPGGNMPMGAPPTGLQSMMGAVERYAADSIARRCPHCGSHTTELLNGDGKSRCHACKEIFTTQGVADTVHPGQATASTWNVDEDLRKEAEHNFDDDTGTSLDQDPPPGVPSADQTHPRDIRQEQDPGHTWLDDAGNPLKVGQEYKMYTKGYDIPDLIRIEAVKSEAVVYVTTGEFGIDHGQELSREEANIEGVSFTPAHIGHGEPDEGLEQNNDDNTGYEGEPEKTDMSAPHGMVSASVVSSGVPEQRNPQLDWLKTGGANYTAMEQRALIDERGNARNADKLDLSNTHYMQDQDEDHFLFGL